jgi:hypothetical protein
MSLIGEYIRGVNEGMGLNCNAGRRSIFVRSIAYILVFFKKLINGKQK